MRLALKLLGGSGFVLAAFLAGFGVMTTAAGVSVAENETLDYHTEKANVTGAFDDAQESVRENVSGYRGNYINRSILPYIEGFQRMSGAYFDFGYRHPTVAGWYVTVMPYVIYGCLGLYALGWYNHFRRQTVG